MDWIVKLGANFEGHSFYLKFTKLGERAPTFKLEERLASSSFPVYSSSHPSPEQDHTPAHGLDEDLDYGIQYGEDVGAPGLDEEEEKEKEDKAQPKLPPP
ncbi:hypothetical protein N7G274_007180 [Stereocaulon virgatum]|uniref:Uncharacterized protein n=1 Tax=Stereocaulon virgatum TaxID=373712 RepID=A0ABR4A7A6_9LECA